MRNSSYLLALSLLTLQVSAADTVNYIGVTNLSDVQLSDINVTGPANLSNVTLNSAKIIGPLHFEKLTVNGNANIIGPVNGSFSKLGNLNIIGPLILQESEIDSLQVTGSTNLTNTKVKNNAEIVGSFDAQKSSLNDLTITSNKISLSETSANNILIKKNSHEFGLNKEQVLRVENKTIISGNVTFESKMGKILISKDSKVNGEVIGAEVQSLED